MLFPSSPFFQFEYRDAVDRVNDVPTLYPADDDDDKYKKKKPAEKLSTWWRSFLNDNNITIQAFDLKLKSLKTMLRFKSKFTIRNNISNLKLVKQMSKYFRSFGIPTQN